MAEVRPFRCPHCGADETRPSRVAGWDGRFLLVLGAIPMRCRTCRRRFAAWPWTKRGPALPRESRAHAGKSAALRRRAARWNARKGRRLRRKLIVASFIAIALLLLFAVLARDWSAMAGGAQS